MKKALIRRCFVAAAATLTVFSFAACSQKEADGNNSNASLPVQSETTNMLSSSELAESTFSGNESEKNGSTATGSAAAASSNKGNAAGNNNQGGNDVLIDVGGLDFETPTASTGSAAVSSKAPTGQTGSKTENSSSSKVNTPAASGSSSSSATTNNDGWTHDYIIKK